MRTNKYILMLASLAMLSATSCVDWLDQEPMSNVTTGAYFKSVSDFQNGANFLYSQLQGYNYNYSLFDTGTDLNYLPNTELSGNDGAPSSDDYYKRPYEYLRKVNDLLEQAAKFKGGNIDSSIGTAYFFRAWWHFNLLQRFGGVSLALSVPSTYSDFVWGPRNSRYEVISSVLSDLEKAQQYMSAVTKSSTNNSGALTVEAVSAFKARVCLFEATWEKYNGRGAQDATNGDGKTSGAGYAMPSDYPSVEKLLEMAKTESGKFVAGGEYAGRYSIWMECEDSQIDYYQNKSYFYLFALEAADSNPYGASKASNDESIFRKCFDFDLQSYGGANLTHSMPCGGSRKLMDMYLCSDGLPVHKSPLFKGYKAFNDEFINRDARMTSSFKQIGEYYWSCNNEFGKAANYSIAPSDDASNLGGIYAPVLTTYSGGTFNGNNGYVGRKFSQERSRATTQESADLMLIRYPEMLLTYAESVFELSGNITDSELENTVNIIRSRAHIAGLTNSMAQTYGLNVLEEIRRERTIELYGEGFRRLDLCRWAIAEAELSRPVCTYYAFYEGEATELAVSEKPGYPGIIIYDDEVWANRKVTADTPQSVYSQGMPPVKAGCLITEPASERNFAKKNYLQPIPTDQIVLNEELTQNPQW